MLKQVHAKDRLEIKVQKSNNYSEIIYQLVPLKRKA